jgi:hypothetical protein
MSRSGANNAEAQRFGVLFPSNADEWRCRVKGLGVACFLAKARSKNFVGPKVNHMISVLSPRFCYCRICSESSQYHLERLFETYFDDET